MSGIVRVEVDLMSSELLAIGEVAGLGGKAPSAIRYYESIGMLPKPARVSGRRRYPAEVGCCPALETCPLFGQPSRLPESRIRFG